jgi:phage-related protein
MFFLRNNMELKKVIRLDKRADKEIKKFPATVQAKVSAMLKILARDGKLEEPYGKKIDKELLEIRIKHQGQWRILYAYLVGNLIIVLSGFKKKTMKTPLQEIDKAKSRLKEYKI